MKRPSTIAEWERWMALYPREPEEAWSEYFARLTEAANTKPVDDDERDGEGGAR